MQSFLFEKVLLLQPTPFFDNKRNYIIKVEQKTYTFEEAQNATLEYFGGDALALAGALATVKEMQEKDVMGHVWKIGNILLDGLKALVEKHNVGNVVSVVGLAPHAGVAFDGAGSLNYLDIHSVFNKVMLENGILFYAFYNLSLSHTEDDAKKLLDAADLAFAEIRKALDNDSLDGILPDGARVDPVFKRNIK